MELAIFLLFAALAIGSSIVVVVHRNPVYSTMSLVLTLFSVAVLFVLLGAPFIATLQVLIYAGAILVLFLFVIMLLNVGSPGAGEGGPRGHLAQRLIAPLAAAVFALLLLLLFWRAGTLPAGPLTAALVSLTGLAEELFRDYLLPFEIIGLLLLVAVVGATVIARRPAAEQAAAGAELTAGAPVVYGGGGGPGTGTGSHGSHPLGRPERGPAGEAAPPPPGEGSAQ